MWWLKKTSVLGLPGGLLAAIVWVVASGHTSGQMLVPDLPILSQRPPVAENGLWIETPLDPQFCN